MNRRTFTPQAFTVLELLMVIAIIGILAALIFPVTQGMVDRGRTVACESNLRQLWAAVQASANDNDNTFPEIKINPDDNSAGEDAKELKETLLPYGITDQVLQCAADIKGPNWFSKVHTSYMWIPIVEDENTSSVKMYGRRRVVAAKPSRVPMLQDYEAVHPPSKPGGLKTMNTIYLDGHLKPR